MKKNNLLTGALIMSVGGMMAKVFSAIYRIVLTRILGGVGIGIYQLIFPLFSLCVVLATAGLPMAISKVISRNVGKEKSVLKKCFLFTSLISLTLAFILIVFSKPLAILQGEEKIYLCYIILAPSIIIVSFSSVFRGYFQGKQNFTPSAISNILEQFTKLAFGLILTLWLSKFGVMQAIIGAIISIVISEIVSIFVLFLYYKKSKKSYSDINANIEIKSIIKDVLPITLTNIILPIASFIDSVLVVNLLAINFTKPMSVFMYGVESGAVASLTSLPTIFSFAIASVILPNIVNLKSNFNKSQSLSLGVKVILIICIPCVICFTLIPNRLIDVLYADRLNGLGVEGLNIAKRLLAISGIGVIFLAINQVYSSSLQAIDQRNVTIRNLIIGIIVKFVIELTFMPSRLINIYALSISNVACYMTVMILNHFEIRQSFKLNIDLNFTAKLIFASCAMTLALILVLVINNSWANTLLAIVFAGIVYLYSLYKLKIADKKELAILKYIH